MATSVAAYSQSLTPLATTNTIREGGLVPRSLGEPVWYAGETPPGGRGPSEIVLVRTISEKGR